MKILILGSEGQVGLGLKEVCRRQKVDFFCMDIKIHPDHDLRLNNNKILKDFIERSDFVVFLAFDIGGSKYMENSNFNFEFINNNLKIMQNVFQELAVSKKPFIFASSQMSNMNFSTYGLLKLVGEKASASLNGRFCKFWNVYGFEDNDERSHVITDFIRMGLREKHIKMRTDGSEAREFLHALDAGEAILAIVRNYDFFNEYDSIDISNFESTRIITIAEIISQQLKSEQLEVAITPSSAKDSVQKGQVNVPKRTLLQFWKPKININEGIREIINFEKINEI